MNDPTENPDERLAREALSMIRAQDLSRWSDAHDRVVIDALRAHLLPEPAPAAYGMSYMDTLVRGELYRTEDEAYAVKDQRDTQYGTRGMRSVVPLYCVPVARPQPEPPTPERLLSIARVTGLRQHLHGLAPQYARPMLATFVRAASIPAGQKPNVGDRVKLLAHEAWPPANVTELTATGFKWTFDAPHVSHARMGLVIEGGEEMGCDGWALLVPACERDPVATPSGAEVEAGNPVSEPSTTADMIALPVRDLMEG